MAGMNNVRQNSRFYYSFILFSIKPILSDLLLAEHRGQHSSVYNGVKSDVKPALSRIISALQGIAVKMVIQSILAEAYVDRAHFSATGACFV